MFIEHFLLFILFVLQTDDLIYFMTFLSETVELRADTVECTSWMALCLVISYWHL